MRVIPIIEHLKTNCLLLAGRVEHTPSLEALSDEEIEQSLPIAFVHAGLEKGSENQLITGVSQSVGKQFIIRIAAQPPNATDEPLEDVRDEIKNQLVGKKLFTNGGSVRLVKSGPLDISKRVIWWDDIYEVPEILCRPR